jgi:hypothetical protein
MKETPIVLAAFGSVSGVGLLWLVQHHQFAIACMAAGLVIGGLFELNKGWAVAPAVGKRLLKSECIFGIWLVLFYQFHFRDAPPRKGFDVKLTQSGFDREVKEYLDVVDAPQAMIVGNNFNAFLQARTGHPVMAHWQTGSMAIYTWEFAPSIQKILKEIYGIAYGESLDGTVPNQPMVWHETWVNRTRAEWETLGETYDFNYVLSPNGTPVNLAPMLQGEKQTLYAIVP